MTTRLKLKSAKRKSNYKRRKSLRKKSVRRSIKKKSLSKKNRKQTSKNDGLLTSSKTRTDLSKKKKYDIIILEKCPFCNDLVDILKKNKIKYNHIEIERNVDEEEKKTICKKIITDKFSKEHNTFPMIFHNGKFLGGLDKMKKILSL